MDKKDKNPNVPNLRFAEYLDTWNNQRIDSNSLIVDGTHQTPNYITEGVKFVSVENIKNPYESNKFISKEDYNSYKIKPRIGDILMTRITAGIIGETYVINKTEDLGYYVSLALIRPDNKYINSNFLSYYINSPYFKHELDKRIIKVAFPRKINLNDIGECKISIPSLIEQEKIATLLNKIDRRIETQSKIINKYKSLINQIYDCLLWNFKDTKKIKLSDILIEKNEKSKINDQYPFLSSTVKGLFLQSEYFDREIASSNNIGYKITNKRDIIISPQNLWMGNITYNDKYDNGLVSPSYKIYTINDKYNPTYISTLLKSYRALYMFKTVSEQGASIVRRNLNLDSFYEISFNIPSKKEQDKISKLINSFNIKISLEEKYLQDLQYQKKFLLDNMFI